MRIRPTRCVSGWGGYGAFEEALDWHLAQYAHAYYLFGLGLRQEVIAALQPEVT